MIFFFICCLCVLGFDIREGGLDKDYNFYERGMVIIFLDFLINVIIINFSYV